MLPPVVGSGVIVQAGGAWLLPPSVPSVVVGVVVVLGGARLLPPFDVTGAGVAAGGLGCDLLVRVGVVCILRGVVAVFLLIRVALT